MNLIYSKSIVVIIFTQLFFFIPSAFAEETRMRYVLFGLPNKIELGAVETKTKTIKTGDHHCESSCKGEPTRTAYRIDMSFDQKEYKVVGASLSCNSGLCAYSHSHGTGYSNNTAWGTFDVWSRPMNWTLNVQVRSKKTIGGSAEQIDSDTVDGGKIFIVSYDKSKFQSIYLDVDLPELGTVRVDPKNPPLPFFKKIAVSEAGKLVSYSLYYQGPSIDDKPE
ncbi:hypothetical protein NBRC116602_30140 [Hyphomicrobiales bacterium 4NK60-0047b]